MSNIPKDKMNIVFFIFLLHGVGTLMPWNFVITANDYFIKRLQSDNRTIEYSTSFLPYIGIASKLPNISAQAINFFLLGGLGSLAFRILSSIVIQIIMFVLLIGLVLINFDAFTFYCLTMLVVVGINLGNGVYQNCLYGSAAILPSKYTNAVVIGNNISGVFSAILMIVSVAIAPDETKSAFYYFLTATVYLGICFVTYFIVKTNPYYNFYKRQQFTEDDAGLTTEYGKETGEPEPITVRKMIECLYKIWPQCLNTFLVFFVSLCMFPSVLSGVRQTGDLISKKYFSAVACFLMFNTFAMIGNYSSEYLPKIPRKILWIPVLMRFAFIPIFLFCNYQPFYEKEERMYPVLIKDDCVFMFLVVLHGFTSGWLSSLSMMYTPMTVDSKYKATAGMVSSFCLIVGIMVGIYSSLIFPMIMFQSAK